MAPRLSGQTSIFGVVFFVSKSLLGIVRQKTLKIYKFDMKASGHVRILIYRTWPVALLSWATGSVSSSNLSAFKAISSKAREIVGDDIVTTGKEKSCLW